MDKKRTGAIFSSNKRLLSQIAIDKKPIDFYITSVAIDKYNEYGDRAEVEGLLFSDGDIDEPWGWRVEIYASGSVYFDGNACCYEEEIMAYIEDNLRDSLIKNYINKKRK